MFIYITFKKPEHLYSLCTNDMEYMQSVWRGIYSTAGAKPNLSRSIIAHMNFTLENVCNLIR